LTTYPLPDGRKLNVESRLDKTWHLRVERSPSAEIVGSLLNSALAELLGYAIAHEE
jgi:hypothetical protein